MSAGERTGGPRRHPASGGYARGEEQRARIINAALKVFGEEGYERASTRRIASEAGIQPPALQYYFDGKEGLNRACAEFIIGQATSLLDGPLETAKAVIPDASPAEAMTALCDLLDAIVDASLFSQDVPAHAEFSARAQSEDSPAGPLIREKIVWPILDACAGLITRATGSPVDDLVRLRASVVVGQVSAFHVHRDTTLQKLGWPDFDGARRDMVKAVLRAHTRGALAAVLEMTPPSA